MAVGYEGAIHVDPYVGGLIAELLSCRAARRSGSCWSTVRACACAVCSLCSERALILFFGPSRLAAELPPERIERLRNGGCAAEEDPIWPWPWPVHVPPVEHVPAAVPASPLETIVDGPCASVIAELKSERERRLAVDQRLERARAELSQLRERTLRLRRELLIVTIGTVEGRATPIGAFLRSDEALEIAKLGERAGDSDLLWNVCNRLEPFPIELLPGEGTWIAKRCLAKDWGDYGPHALLDFFGRSRLEAELPMEHFAALRERYPEAFGAPIID